MPSCHLHLFQKKGVLLLTATCAVLIYFKEITFFYFLVGNFFKKFVLSIYRYKPHMSQDRFITLITKEFTNELTASEESELAGLLQDPLLKARYDLFKAYLSNNQSDHSSDERVFNKIRTKIAQQEAFPISSQKSKNKQYLWKVAAAVFVLIIASIAIMTYLVGISTRQIAYTERAAKKSFTLPDGSKVVLNAESKLIYPKTFKDKQRQVTLVGEGFFDIAKDPKHPFIIHTEQMDIKVLGTSFNLKSYPDDPFSETTLLTGAIEVTLKDRPADRLTLMPSEKLIVRNPTAKDELPESKSSAITQITHLQKMDNTVIETSWIFNKLIFAEQSFVDVSKMLERAYDVKIDFKNQHLKQLKFTGHFERESVTDILNALRLVEPFSYTMQDKKILIY
uniref:Anti-FecI sigma factor, FecR n=2 Tax=Sphingobacteriaceae TaxID=84566 RepID=F4C6N5_SPHS2